MRIFRKLSELQEQMYPSCTPSEEEVIQRVVQNVSFGESTMELIIREGGGYFSSIGAVLSVKEFLGEVGGDGQLFLLLTRR